MYLSCCRTWQINILLVKPPGRVANKVSREYPTLVINWLRCSYICNTLFFRVPFKPYCFSSQQKIPRARIIHWNILNNADKSFIVILCIRMNPLFAIKHAVDLLPGNSITMAIVYWNVLSSLPRWLSICLLPTLHFQ